MNIIEFTHTQISHIFSQRIEYRIQRNSSRAIHIPSQLIQTKPGCVGLVCMKPDGDDPDETYNALVSGIVPQDRIHYAIMSVELSDQCACGAKSPYTRNTDTQKKTEKKRNREEKEDSCEKQIHKIGV